MDASLLTSAGFWQETQPEALGRFPGAIPDFAELRAQVLFETSGSSGAPKWIALPKPALLVSAAAVNRHLDVENTSCWGLALPLHHVGGFGVAARAYEAGCGFREFGRRWDARAFREWLEESRITHSSLVPTQVHDLVAAGLRAPGSLRAIVVGGGHLPAATGQAARALGWPVLASYGMTEAASQIATQGLDSLHALYQPAPIPLLPIWRAEISPEKTLRIAGPALFSGTLVRENEAWIYQARCSEWHQTEDRMLLENRCLTPLGRADALVKVLGELVDPEMIERELLALAEGKLQPGMLAVIAVPDARAGNALVPVFDEAVSSDVIAEILTAYAGQAPGFRRLRPAVMLGNFPRSPLGKPRRVEIAAEISTRGTRGLA
jgi:O-succinylbenzoic acid--CoA ligase